WLYSPISSSVHTSRFFNDLAELTAHQRIKCDMLMKNNLRVLLCAKHVKRPVAYVRSPSSGIVRSIASPIHPSFSAIGSKAHASYQQLLMEEKVIQRPVPKRLCRPTGAIGSLNQSPSK
ncbi:hypothetical protein PMAYCL1PPCAC_22446, partial [Pristionchus mayeri]